VEGYWITRNIYWMLLLAPSQGGCIPNNPYTNNPFNDTQCPLSITNLITSALKCKKQVDTPWDVLFSLLQRHDGAILHQLGSNKNTVQVYGTN
jgi:hypothetical protein